MARFDIVVTMDSRLCGVIKPCCNDFDQLVAQLLCNMFNIQVRCIFQITHDFSTTGEHIDQTSMNIKAIDLKFFIPAVINTQFVI